VAGLFGLGGGVVKAPLMLELGVLPEVAAATSTTMIAFTSMAACMVGGGEGVRGGVLAPPAHSLQDGRIWQEAV
jgi:uncharacterized membrane protein YfcA